MSTFPPIDNRLPGKFNDGRNATPIFTTDNGNASPEAGFIVLNANTNCGSTVSFSGKNDQVTLKVTDGNTNTLIGFHAGNNSITGNSNVGVGSSVLSGLTSGTFNAGFGPSACASVTSGSFNFGLGSFAVNQCTTGTENVGIGVNGVRNLSTGSFNIGIGTSALLNLDTGSSNTCIGVVAGSNYTGAESNNICIGASVAGVVGESDVTRIGLQGTQTKCVIAGIDGATSASGVAVFVNTNGVLGTATSSILYKDDVQDMGSASDALLQCRPVTFFYKIDEDRRLQYGMIAEEVKEIIPSLVVNNTQGQPHAIRYEQMICMLVNEVKKLNQRVKQLEMRTT